MNGACPVTSGKIRVVSEASAINGAAATLSSPVTARRAASPLFTTLGAILAAVLLVVGAYVGRIELAGAYLISGLVLAGGWAMLLGLPRVRSSAAVLGVSALATAVIVAVTDDTQGIRWVTAALAISLALVFLHTLTRRGGPDRVVVSLSSMALGLGALGSGAFVADAALRPQGREAVVAALTAAAVGAVLDGAARDHPRMSEWTLPASLVLGVLIGTATAIVTGVPWNGPLVAGLLGAGVSHAFRSILTAGPESEGRDRSGSALAQLSLGGGSVLFVGVLPTVVSWLFQHVG